MIPEKDDASDRPEAAADVFSRGGIVMTHQLLRKRNPQLSLIVRNILGGKPLPKTGGGKDNKHSDFFRVELDPFKVREVVERLMQAQQDAEASKAGTGLVAKTLYEDWAGLARLMFQQMEDEESQKEEVKKDK